MNMTNEQQRFLSRYINNKGDFYKTVESMGLDAAHILSWQQNYKEFDKTFRETKRIVLQHLKDENYMMATLRINDALVNGVTHHTVTQKHRVIDDEGNSEFEVTRTSKQLGVPSEYIKMALQESSIVKAVNTLSAEGVIPASIARKILQSANKISEEIVASFDVSTDSEFINDKKAINLIRAAVLGEVDV
jgi:hypothetical protein